MKTVNKKLEAYRFAELSEEAKKAVLDDRFKCIWHHGGGFLDEVFERGIAPLWNAAEERIRKEATHLLESNGFRPRELNFYVEVNWDLDLTQEQRDQVLNFLCSEKEGYYKKDGVRWNQWEMEMLAEEAPLE